MTQSENKHPVGLRDLGLGLLDRGPSRKRRGRGRGHCLLGDAVAGVDGRERRAPGNDASPLPRPVRVQIRHRRARAESSRVHVQPEGKIIVHHRLFLIETNKTNM